MAGGWTSQSNWSADDVAILKTSLASGNTFSKTAQILGNRFSRNAVIGKAKRLGVSSTAKRQSSEKRVELKLPTARSKQPSAAAPNPRRRKLIGGVEQIVMSKTDGPASIKPLPRRADQAFDPLPGIEPVPLLKNAGCKWPVDGLLGRGLLVCGAARDVMLPYCDHHTNLSKPAERRI